jgi:CheY-like chemotaxis protein/HPt (histidine-containing phosphotransfer) domain-containing protein
MGFHACLTKPVRKSLLFDALSQLFAKGSLALPGSGAKEPAAIAPLAAGRTVRILLAEDNATNQKVALAILKRLGCRADAVANGAEALKTIQMIPYDLILMDCQMPEMDGYEATRRIRRLPGALASIPIVAMTANALKGDREKCLSAGMDDYLAKPVEPAKLRAVIERLLLANGQTLQAVGSLPPGAGDGIDGEGTASAAVFDKESLLERMEGDAALLDEIVPLFLQDAERRIALLEACVLERRDPLEGSKIAHALKGSAANASAPLLRDSAMALELSLSTGSLEGADKMLETLKSRFAELKSLLASLGYGAKAS